MDTSSHPHVGATRSQPDVSTGSSTRPQWKRTNSWTATSSSIQDSFANFSNAVKRELKERRTSIQLPAARTAPGSRSSQQQDITMTSVDKVDNHELVKNTGTQTGSAGGADQLRRLAISSSLSQPPQLPKPERLSPFDILSPASPWSPPASDSLPALPSLPEPRSLIGNDDKDPGANSQLISPLSDTFPASRRPTPIPKDQTDNREPSLVSLDIADRLRVPAPISKFQPTLDPYTATPLFEEEDFDFHQPPESIDHVDSITNNKKSENQADLPTDRDVISPLTLNSRASNDIGRNSTELAHNTTKSPEDTGSQLPGAQAQGGDLGENKEERSEATTMAAYAQQQQFSQGGYPGSPSAADSYQGHHVQTPSGRPGWQPPAVQTPNQAWEQSQLYDYQPVQSQLPVQHAPQQPPAQQFQYAQPQQQQTDGDLPHRQSSFVGLPPIRRTSTLLGSVVSASEGDNDSTSIAPSQHAGQRPGEGSSQAMGQPHFAHQTQMQHQGTPQQYQIAGGYHPTQPGPMAQNPGMMYQGSHGSLQAQPGFQGGAPGLHSRAFSEPVHPHGIVIPNGDARFSPQPQGEGQNSSPHMIPSVLRPNAGAVSPNGGGHLRLPPQGAWKLEESHLQQPLLSPSRNRSPSNATTPTSTNQPFYGFDKETGLPAAPSTSPQPQGSQPGPPPVDGQGQPQLGPVERSDTMDTADTADLPPPVQAQPVDDRQSKRNSGLFSNIRGRFSREGPEDRRDSTAGHAGSDAISETSVATEELQERRKRHSFFGGHGSSQLSQPAQQATPNGAPGSSPLANNGINNGERTQNAPQTSAYEQRIQQASQPQQMTPPQKQKTFFGLPMGPAEQPTRPSMSRASTSSNTVTQSDAGTPPAGINGGPKKRFSGLTSKVFNRTGNNQNGQKPPGSSHSAKPSFSGGFNGGFSSQQGQLARQPGAPGPGTQQPGARQMYPQQQLQQQGPPQGQQQGQQGSPYQSPQQHPQQFPQGQSALPGQQQGQPAHVGQQSPNMGSTESPRLQQNGHMTPQGQQYAVSSQGQQQQPAQQHPGSQPQQQQFQQRLVQQPSQQTLSQQPQQFQQQQQRPLQQQPGLMDSPPPLGRGRADSFGARPFTAESRPSPMTQHSSSSSVAEEQRGRKPSGGSFFSNIFGPRSGSKPGDSKSVQAQGQPQGPAGGAQRPVQQQWPGQQPNQHGPGQQMVSSPLSQQQQQGNRPMGPPGLYGPLQTGLQQPQPGQFASPGPPGQQQFVHQRQASGQQGPQSQGQQQPQNTLAQSGPPLQQGQMPGVGAKPPMMYPQLQSQLSQSSIAAASHGQQSTLTNGLRRPSMGQLHPNQQDQLGPRTAPGPLNQHPPLETSPPPQDRLREDTVSPPVDDAASRAGAPGSPPLNSPISQVSTTVPFTPVDRQSNDSPMSFRQLVPSQQQPAGANEPPRQRLQAASPGPSTQSPARKPVQSSSRVASQSQASSIHGGSDHSKGSPSISSVHTATATASPVDHSRRPSQQFGQLAPQQTSSPLAQRPQQSIGQQPSQGVPPPDQTPASQPGSGLQGGFPGQSSTISPHFSQAQGGPPVQMPPAQHGTRLVGQQPPPGQAGTATPGRQWQPYAGPQPPWAAGRTSTSGARPQQQDLGPYFQVQAQNNGQDKEQKGTFSKLINKAMEVAHTGKSQDKPEKEKGGKSRFGGFLQSLKQPEQRQQPLQGGPQFQSPPGRASMPQEAQMERLQQLQSQISPSEAQPQPHSTPSPGPHLNYQHQRQSPPNGNSPQAQPTAGSQTPSPGPQQALSPAQGLPAKSPQLPQTVSAPPLQGMPPSAQARPAQGPPAGPQGRAGAAGIGQVPQAVNQRPALAIQNSNEPQYGHVPVPTGYGRVHSEGRIEPAPVAYYMGPHGQFLPVQSGTPGSQPNVQPWVQPSTGQNTGQRQPSYEAPQQQQPRRGSRPPPQVRPSQQSLDTIHSASPPASTPGSATPGFPAGGTHPHPPDPQHPLHVQNPDQPTPGAAPTPQGDIAQSTPNPGAFSPAPESRAQGYAVPASNSAPSRPEPERFLTAMTSPSPGEVASPPPQLQHPGSPQSYPLPDSVFSPVNPAAEHVPTPPLPSPLPKSDLVPSPLRPQGNQLQTAVPPRQVSAVSQVSALHAGSSSNQGPSGGHFAVESGDYLTARSPSPQVTPERNISPEPTALEPPPQTMHINVERANEHSGEDENIYDATPRTESIPLQAPAKEDVVFPPVDEPVEGKAHGTSHVLVEHKEQQQQPLTVNTQPSPSPSPPPTQPTTVPQATASESTTTANGAPPPPPPAAAAGASTNPVDIFEEAKRKAVLRDMEEKIPVFPSEPDAELDAQKLAELAAKKKAEEDRPQMSATSYPGQEWNPYGEGWEDDD